MLLMDSLFYVVHYSYESPLGIFLKLYIVLGILLWQTVSTWWFNYSKINKIFVKMSQTHRIHLQFLCSFYLPSFHDCFTSCCIKTSNLRVFLHREFNMKRQRLIKIIYFSRFNLKINGKKFKNVPMLNIEVSK